jgi:ribosome-associated protein
MRDVIITKEPVELYKILKFEGLVDNGGAAKAAIEQEEVTVNGAIETRKRKQIVAGDVIEFAGHTLRIVREASTDAEHAVPAQAKPKAPAKAKRGKFSGRTSASK